MILQNSNLRLLGSQILPYDLKMWQSALSQSQKKTAQIATIGICTVLALFAVDAGRLSRVGKRIVIEDGRFQSTKRD